MPRTRRSKRELTESWEDVPDPLAESDENSSHEDDHGRSQRQGSSTSRMDFANGQARKRGTRSSVGPELVMPSSPDALNGVPRTKTPHLRLNDRSMTSDAGDFDADRKLRARTPHFRMNERSFTSDAGTFARRASTLRAVNEDADGDQSISRHLGTVWYRVLQPIFAYCADIVGMALNNAKPLIAYGLFVYVIVAALIFGSGFITTTIHQALSPICRIPGVTYFFDPSFCPVPTTPEIAGPAEFDKLIQAQSAFNDVLAASETGLNLPLDMKKSEAGIRDLKHVVEYSSLPSKNELVYEFAGFIDTAKQASQDLSKFNSRIGRAVDRILSTNRWTLSVIDGVTASDAGRGSVSRFVSDHLNMFAPFQPVSLTRDILLDQYLHHTSAVEEQIDSLISEAQALLGILENLDGRLDVIASIAVRDGLKAEDNRDELFAYLWTKLGGNRSSVKKLNGHIELLKNVGQYRRIAWAHVTSTIVKLQAIRDNLEDLRERVAMPETVGTDKVPLEVHIEAINLGIQRLEEQRDSSRKLEDAAYRRVISKAEAGEGRFIGDGES